MAIDGALLRALRQQAGFKMRPFAARAGVSHALVSEVELGHRTCNERLLAAYAAL